MMKMWTSCRNLVGQVITFPFVIFGTVGKVPSVGRGEPPIARFLCLEALMTSD